MRKLILAMAVVLVAGCGSPVDVPEVTTTVPEITTTITQIPVEVEVLINGKTADEWNAQMEESAAENDRINACMDEWDGFVGEWNDLVVADETDGYGGYEDFATEKGYPQTYEEHCPDAP
jgi:outer membrane murein-binding lipoprotein Lpp